MDLATVGIVVSATGAVIALNSFTGAAGRATTAGVATERMALSLGHALTGLGLAFGIREMVEYADTWTLINSRIGLVTNSTEQQAAVMHELFDVAQRTRANLDASASVYQRMAVQADNLGVSHRDILQFIEGVNNALLTTGATSVEASQGIRQLGQALAKGKLDGDEFRTVMEAMPAVARALAASLDVTTQELFRMSAAGELTARQLIAAMLAQREEFAAMADEIPITVGQAFTQLGNELTRFIGITSEGTGASRAMAGAIQGIGNNLPAVTAGIGAVVTGVIAYNVAVNMAAIRTAVFTAVGNVTAFLQMARAVRSLADAMALASAAGRGFIGIVAAVAAATAGYLAYKTVLDRIMADTEDWEAGLASLEDQIGNTTMAAEGLSEAELKRIAARRAANEDMVRQAEQAIELARREGLAQELLRLRYDAVNKTIAVGREWRGELLRETEAAIARERELLEEAAHVADALDRANARLREQEQILERFRENVQRSFADLFDDILNNGINSFGDLFDSVKKMFTRMVAEMAAAEMMRKWGGAMAAALAAVFGGWEGAGAQVPPPMPGGAGPIEGVTPVILAGVTATVKNDLKDIFATLGPMIATALASFAVGNIIGGMTTNRGLGGAGGALGGAATGAAIGTFLLPGLGTAAGAAIGAIAGLIGGIKGATEARRREREELEKIAAYRTAFEQNIALRELEVQGRTEEAEVLRLQFQHENELAAARKDGILTQRELIRLQQLQAAEMEALRQRQEEARREALAAAEEELAQTQAEIQASREALRLAELVMRQDLEVRRLRAVGLTEEAAQLELILRQRREMSGASGFSQEARDTLAGVHQLEQLAFEAERARRERAAEIAVLEGELRELRATARAQIKAIQESSRAALEVLRKQEKEIRDGHKAQITSLQSQMRLQDNYFKEQIALTKDNLSLSRAQLREAEQQVGVLRKVVGSLEEYLSKLVLNSGLSTMGPELRYGEAQRQFQALVQAAMGGNAEAAQDLPGAANSLLEAARVMFASGPGYVEVFRNVQQTLLEVSGSYQTQLSVGEQQVAILSSQVSQQEAHLEALESQRAETKAGFEAQIEATRQQMESELAAINLLQETIAEDAERQIAIIEAQLAATEKGYLDQIAAIEAAQTAAEKALEIEAQKIIDNLDFDELIDIDVQLRDLTQAELNKLEEIRAEIAALGGKLTPTVPGPHDIGPGGRQRPDDPRLLDHQISANNRIIEQQNTIIRQNERVIRAIERNETFVAL